MIVLLTDFGDSEYVGMMKGAIYTIHPEVQIVDLTHAISPQSIREGAWVLLQSYRYFPKDTIFVCVVDPGVGTERAAVAVLTENYTFIGPDNGLMYPAAVEDGIRRVFGIPMIPESSSTFHGRDIFARTAAYFACEKGLSSLSSSKSPQLDVSLHFYHEGRKGEVVRIDRFGNILTNIPPLDIQQYGLRYENKDVDLKFSPTYEDGPDDELFLVTGSSGYLEIVVKNGRASDRIKLSVGDYLTLA